MRRAAFTRVLVVVLASFSEVNVCVLPHSQIALIRDSELARGGWHTLTVITKRNTLTDRER